MSFNELMGLTQRLNMSVEALAALTAELRVRAEGLEPAPEVRELFNRVLTAMGVESAMLGGLSSQELQAAAGAMRAFFRQAADLMDQPDRPPGWTFDDPILLTSQGRASMLVAGLVDQVSPALGDLDDRLRAPGAAVLDVGTGVGLLAVAMCQTFPTVRVTGIDPWRPSLELAAKNVVGFGLSERIELRAQSILDLDDLDAFDAAWVPAPFLRREVVAPALDRTRAALRPNGWAILGLYAAPAEPLAEALTDLRIVRSGGHPWAPDEAARMLTAAGFVDVRVIERTWHTPILFVAGRRP